MTALCMIVCAVLGFALGTIFEEWRAKPPRGYDLIVMPKDTHLIFEDRRVRVVKYGEENL